MSISVLVVEDDAFTRATLAAALEKEGFSVLGPSGNVATAIDSFNTHRQDVLLADLDLGTGPGGVELSNLLRKASPQLGVVFLTSFEDPRLHRQSLDRLPGGSKYLVKQSLVDTNQIANAIKEAKSQALLADPKFEYPSIQGFTDVQIETMQLVAEGLSNSEIAKQRFVSEKAIEKTVKLIAEQLQLAPDSSKNLRVSITRAYLKLTGGKA
jgi:DNA-binding NarL/FixJ family response regulator